MIVASFPSPSHGVWHLGPLPVRAYALAILLGVVVAIWVGERRWVRRGGTPGTAGDIAVWAVPFGLIGARLYHVATDPELYFSSGKNPWAAFYIWEGGLGIWGAIAAGCLGGYLACRRKGISFLAIADAFAPGIVLAQAIGRWGNYFNQELYGRPSTLPWAVEIDPAHRESGMQQYATYQPTFLYESIWDVGVAGLVIWAERRFRLGFGRAFALYVMAYTVGRTWIEYLRVDTANHLFGVRLNVFTSVVLFLLALLFFVVSAKRHPGQPVIGGEGPDSMTIGADLEAADADVAGREDSDADVSGAADSALEPVPSADDPASGEPASDTARDE